MNNSYSKLPTNRSSSQNSFTYLRPITDRNNTCQQKGKYKLFAILICRATYRQMR